jgi:hypothetical protein
MNTSPRMTWPTIRAAAHRGIANWRIGILWIAATLIPTAIVSLPIGRLLSKMLDHSAFAGEWAKGLNLAVIMELVSNSTEFAPALVGAAVISALVTLLLWPLLSAMIVSTLAEAQPAGFVALLMGGVRAYGRMFRMLLWSLVPFGIAGAIGGGVLHVAQNMGEKAVLQSSADHAYAAAVTLLVVLLVLAHMTVEAGRAQLALDSGRRSAVKAWWRGVKLIKARPLAAFASYLALTGAGLISMAVIGWVRINLPHAGLMAILVAFCLTQLIVIAAVWMRSARLFAMIQISYCSTPVAAAHR